MEKVYCKNCVRWYFTKADQCNIPDCGILLNKRIEYKKITNINEVTGVKNKIKIGKIDIEGQDFIKNHLEIIQTTKDNKEKIYGHPTELNKNNDCYFYKPLLKYLKWLTLLVRYFYS